MSCEDRQDVHDHSDHRSPCIFLRVEACWGNFFSKGSADKVKDLASVSRKPNGGIIVIVIYDICYHSCMQLWCSLEARSEGKEGKAPPRRLPSLSTAKGFAKWRKGALAVRFVPVLSPWLKRVWQSPCTGIDNSSKWNSRSYQIIWIIWIICHFCQPFLQMAVRSLVAIVYASKRVRKRGSEHMLTLRFGDFSSWISFPKMEIEAVSIAYPPCLSSASVQPAPKQSECCDTSLQPFKML